jgi:hypothetical protein
MCAGNNHCVNNAYAVGNAFSKNPSNIHSPFSPNSMKIIRGPSLHPVIIKLNSFLRKHFTCSVVTTFAAFSSFLLVKRHLFGIDV